MAKDYITLSAAQKEEVRRLTQFANRRIANAFKTYEKEGMDVVPREITGGIQTREQWATDKYAISRSIKFSSQKEYREQLHWLRQFEVMRPSITEYSTAQQEKTLLGLETALGDVPNALKDMVKKLNAPELTRFWKTFSDKASKMTFRYSSQAAAQEAVVEFFGTDRQDLARGLATELGSGNMVKAKQTKYKAPKAKQPAKPKTKRARKKAAKKATRK
jgi:hypothetical protein